MPSARKPENALRRTKTKIPAKRNKITFKRKSIHQPKGAIDEK
jgi:hypothetical protein